MYKNKKVIKEIVKIRKMMGLNEQYGFNIDSDTYDSENTSYSRFMKKYESELSDSVRKLRKITKDVYESKSEEEYSELEDRMSNYDENVGDSIEHMVVRGEINSEEIAKLAMDINNREGTEPQMIFDAIDDFVDFFDVSEDERSPDMPGFEGTWNGLDDL